MPTWQIIDSGANSGVCNMALDQELLAAAQAGRFETVLRFYTWDPPGVSVGRFQDIETAVHEDACSSLGFDIVRRITGGRAVLHRKELTYSIVARTDDGAFPSSVLGTYRLIAEGLVAGLRSMDIPAQLVTRENRYGALVQMKPKCGACFSSPSWYEIVVNGRKVVGSAQRRVSGAFLQHGSILLDYDPILESRVIRGSGAGDAVTSIKREMGRDVNAEEVGKAIMRGFSQMLNVQFTKRTEG